VFAPLASVFFRFCATLAGGLWLAASAHPAAAAQSVVDPAYRTLYDEAFHATYAAPGDVEAALNFAKVATLAGDLEGAIGALERVLIFNPDLPEIDFELGRLYRALGALDTARMYFQRADPARLSADERAERDTALAEIAGATARNKFSGAAALGLRYQTNANAGAVEATRLAQGPPGMPPPPAGTSFRGRPDADAFAAVTGQHSYDFGDQSGDSWDSRLSLYGTRQFHRHLVNVSVAEIDTGPRFHLGTAATDPSWRPYILTNLFELGGTTYFVSNGGGVNGHMQLAPGWTGDATLEMRNLKFYNSSLVSTATDKDGAQAIGRAVMGYQPTQNDLITVLVQATNYDARASFETYQEIRLSSSYTHRFDMTWAGMAQPWTASLAGGPLERRYDRADPSLDPGHRRQDGEWDLDAALTIGLTEQVAFRLELQQVWANSNILIYQYRDTAVLGSIELRF
jgi:hypothetical protein